MSEWRSLVRWMYGDTRTDRGFWYSHVLDEVSGLTDEELLWVPDEKALCILWQVGHIAHRERYHFARLIQRLEGQIIPPQYEVFGTDWCSVAQIKDSIDSVAGALDWVDSVRQESVRFIDSLSDEDFHKPAADQDGLTVGHWILITVAHGSLHIGKIQLLRNLLMGKPDNPC